MGKDIDYDSLDRRLGILIAERFGEGHELLQDCGIAAIMTALLIRVARADGTITAAETDQILVSLQEVFGITGAKALELINTIASELARGPALQEFLTDLSEVLTNEDKATALLLLLRIIAADGTHSVVELAVFSETVECLAVPPDVVHQVFDTYYAETYVDDSDPD